MCYGQAVSRATFSALYAALGGASSPWGQGDGISTFNLPDLRGRVVAGPDNMGGTAANRLGGSRPGGITGAAVLGATGGEQNHLLAADNSEIPAHAHGLTNGVVQSSGFGGGFAPSGSAGGGLTSTESTGGGLAHNNTQPTALINYIIKT
jgi:microcystin-dependent protein